MSGLRVGPQAAWARRIVAFGGQPESLVAMSRAVRWTLDLAFAGETGPPRGMGPSTPLVDWESVYSAKPAALDELLRGLDPSLSVLPPAGVDGPEQYKPLADSSLGLWLRCTTEALGRMIQETDELVDPKTGLVPDEILADTQFDRLRGVTEPEAKVLFVEIQAAVHDAAAFLAKKRSMADLLRAAIADGSDDALLVALQINPQLIELNKIDLRVQEKVKARDVRFLRRLTRALSRKADLRASAVIGLIVEWLWEAGLKRLTYTETRGFLKEAGFERLPTTRSLERLIQRQGLRKYSKE